MCIIVFPAAYDTALSTRPQLEKAQFRIQLVMTNALDYIVPENN